MSDLTLMSPADCIRADAEQGPFVPAWQAYQLLDDLAEARAEIQNLGIRSDFYEKLYQSALAERDEWQARARNG